VLTEHEVNALPGIVMRVDGRVVGVISLGLRGRAISAIWVVLNPDKLTHWNAH
jgi:RNA polymerase sigma-70 factor (ECF subfamily)